MLSFVRRYVCYFLLDPQICCGSNRRRIAWRRRPVLALFLYLHCLIGPVCGCVPGNCFPFSPASSRRNLSDHVRFDRDVRLLPTLSGLARLFFPFRGSIVFDAVNILAPFQTRFSDVYIFGRFGYCPLWSWEWGGKRVEGVNGAVRASRVWWSLLINNRACSWSQSNYTMLVLFLFDLSSRNVITQRVQQLQGSMDDASNRLAPAEAARSKWINPTELNPQQVQQHLDQLKVRIRCESNEPQNSNPWPFLFSFLIHRNWAIKLPQSNWPSRKSTTKLPVWPIPASRYHTPIYPGWTISTHGKNKIRCLGTRRKRGK